MSLGTWVVALAAILLGVSNAVDAETTPVLGSITYRYDSAAHVVVAASAGIVVSTTVGPDTLSDAPHARQAATSVPWSSTSRITRFRATKAGRGAGEAFHYTRSEVAGLIEENGLLPGSYLTKNGGLSPLQAQLDLALPPNRGLPGALIRVDLAGLRKAGYNIGDFTKVGRKYNMPGGGTELEFERAIPPQFVKVVQK